MSDVNFDDRFNNNLPDYVSLTPVDYDPFGRAAQRTRAHYEKANQRMSGLPDVLNVIGGRVASGLTAPLDALTGKLQVNDPETGMPTQEAMGRAGDVAGLTGIGSPFAVKGALGSAGGKLMQMENKAPPFYSALEHAVTNVKQEKMPADQWLGTISNAKGVKPEELDWTGFKDFLAEKGKQPVTKAEVQEHLNNNKVELKEVRKGKLEDGEVLTPNDSGFDPDRIQTTAATKYSQYQLPGGENYREMLMTLPEKKLDPETFAKQFYDNWVKRGGDPEWEQLSKSKQEDWIRAADETNMIGKAPGNYQSSHWDEPNILAHVRMNDRNIEGKKSLHLEEIQSDWHQQGREKGYNNINELKGKEKKIKLQDAPQSIIDSIKQAGWKDLDRIKNDDIYTYGEKNWSLGEPANEETLKEWTSEGVPDAPFKKSWHELALKRMIREAAEKGYDRLSWTPGEAQAARYDLSKSIDELHYNPETHKLVAKKNGNHVVNENNVPPEKLPDYIGKEAAKKIMDQEPNVNGLRSLKNQELRIGGEGMKGFYDQIIPKAIEKIGKEHGVKVKTAETNTMNVKKEYKINRQGEDQEKPFAVYGDGEYLGRFASKDHAEQYIEGRRAGEKEQAKDPNSKVHYIDIPKSLKDTAMSKGFPLFSSGLPFNLTPIDHDPFEKKK